MTDLPFWPWPEDEHRIERTGLRDRLLEDNWDEDLHGFLNQVWGPVKRAAVGVLDYSWNALRILVEQLSQPGLYGVRPQTFGAPGSEGLIGDHGLLDQAGWSELCQDVEYRARGLGDCFVRPFVRDGRLVLTLIKPWSVHVETDPREPTRPVMLAQLVRYQIGDKARWCFEVFDLREPGNPRWWVEQADKTAPSQERLKVTNLAYPTVTDMPADGYSGAKYPWKYKDGTAFIPYAHYTTRRGSSFWSDWRLRGLERGTFHAARLSMTAMYAADAASCNSVIMVNAHIVGAEVKNPGRDAALRSMELLPGTILHAEGDPDKQPLVVQVGPGADVMSLWSTCRSMIVSMLAAHGLRESDVVRNDANPTSAAALVISDGSRREAQRQVRPHFERADLELFRMCAALCRAHGLGDFPEDGYRIIYRMIPATPAELATEREEQGFELDQGLLSKVQLYMRRNNVDRETAIAALAQVQKDGEAVEKALGNTDVVAGITIEVGKAQQVKEIVEAVALGQMDSMVAEGLLAGVYGLPPSLAQQLTTNAQGGASNGGL